MSKLKDRKKYKRSEKGRAAEARYRDNNRGSRREQQLEYYAKAYRSPHGRALSLCKSAKRRAKSLGVAFELEPSAIEAFIVFSRCELTGIAFDLSDHSDSYTSPWAPSLDRKDPRGGYTAENVRVVCWAVNRALSDWGLPVLLQLAEALAQRQSARS